MRALICLFGILISAGASSTFAQSAKSSASLVANSFEESIDASRPISGHLLAGVELEPSGGSIFPLSIDVLTPPKFSGQIEVSVATSDARYTGRALYTVVGSGWISLPYPRTPAQSRLSSSERVPSSVLAKNIATQEVFLTRRASSSPETINIYVNSERSRAFVQVRGAGVRQPCEDVPAQDSIRFDKICSVLASQVSDNTVVRVSRQQGGQALPPIDISISR